MSEVFQESGQLEASFLPQPLTLRKILYRSSVKGSHRNKLQFSQAEQIAMLHQMTGGQLYQGGPSTDITIRDTVKNTQVKGRAYFQQNGRVVVDVCELMKEMRVSEGDIIVFKSTNVASVLEVHFILAKCEVCTMNNEQVLVQCSSSHCAKSFHPECFPNNQICPTKCPYCNVGKLNVLDRQGLVSNTSVITLQTLYQNLNVNSALSQNQLQVGRKRSIQDVGQFQSEQQQQQYRSLNTKSINSGILNGSQNFQQCDKKAKTSTFEMEQNLRNQLHVAKLQNNSKGPRLPPRRIKMTADQQQEVQKQVGLLSEQIKISTDALKDAQTALDSVLAALEDSQFLITQFCEDNVD